MLAEAVEIDPARACLDQHTRLVGAGGEQGHDVEPGGDPADLHVRELALERTDEYVAAAAVTNPHAPQVPVELATLEEVRKGELLESGWRDHAVEHLIREQAHECRRGDQPAESQGRREGLAGRAEIGDALGREPLERPYGCAVVAELGVVVVLDHERVSSLGPLEQGGSALWGEDDPGRELVGGRHEYRVDVRSVERRDVDALVVHGDRRGRQAGAGHDLADHGMTGVLDADRLAAKPSQDGAEQANCLGETAAHEGVLGPTRNSTRSAEVGDERSAQRRRATNVAVGELLVRRSLQGRAIRLHPFLAWKARVVGKVRPQVVARALLVRLALEHDGLADGPRDPRRGAPAEDEIPLGPELRVGADDEAARGPELGGQRPSRGKHGSRLQPPFADRLAELPLELCGKRLDGAAIEPDQQFRRAAQLVHEISTEVDLNNDQRTVYLGAQRTIHEAQAWRGTMVRTLLFCTTCAVVIVATGIAATGTPQVVAKIETGAGPCSEIGGFGYVWVGVGGANALARIDPATNTVTASIPVGAGPCGVATGAGSVWVDGYGSHSVIRVNPATLKVVKRITLPDQIWDVAFGAGAVWATEPNLGYVLRINPRTNKVGRKIKIPGFAGPANLRFGAGAVWVGSLLGRRVFRIDPRTNKVTWIRVGRTPRSLAASSSAIWVSNHLSNTVSRINPKTRKVVATIRVGKQPENAAIADDGTVFVPNLGSNTVSRIDPATNTVVDTIPVGTKPFPTASAFGDIWVPSAGGTDVYRIHIG